MKIGNSAKSVIRNRSILPIMACLVALGLVATVIGGIQGVNAQQESEPGARSIFYMFMDREKGDRPVGEAPDFTDFDVIEVAERIYMIQGNSGNIGICVGEDGVLLIDDGFPAMTNALLEAVANITDQPITMVLNTHWHWDHSGGNVNMAAKGATILAQEDSVQWMTTWQVSGMSGTPKKPQGVSGIPQVTFNDEMTLRMNGYTIRVRNVGPAHTLGDTAVYFEEANVVQVGDIYTTGDYPWIDLNTGGDLDGLVNALDNVVGDIEPDTIIMPGHNELSNGAELTAYRDMVKLLRDRIQSEIDNGKTRQEILAMDLTADIDEDWANPIINSELIVLVYHASLMGEGTKTAEASTPAN